MRVQVEYIRPPLKRSDYIKYLWLLLLAIPIGTVLILLREEAFRFEHKEYLWLLAAVAPMLILFLLFQNWRRKNLDRFANSSLLAQLTPESTIFLFAGAPAAGSGDRARNHASIEKLHHRLW